MPRSARTRRDADKAAVPPRVLTEASKGSAEHAAVVAALRDCRSTRHLAAVLDAGKPSVGVFSGGCAYCGKPLCSRDTIRIAECNAGHMVATHRACASDANSRYAKRNRRSFGECPHAECRSNVKDSGTELTVIPDALAEAWSAIFEGRALRVPSQQKQQRAAPTAAKQKNVTRCSEPKCINVVRRAGTCRACERRKERRRRKPFVTAKREPVFVRDAAPEEDCASTVKDDTSDASMEAESKTPPRAPALTSGPQPGAGVGAWQSFSGPPVSERNAWAAKSGPGVIGEVQSPESMEARRLQEAAEHILTAKGAAVLERIADLVRLEKRVGDLEARLRRRERDLWERDVELSTRQFEDLELDISNGLI